MAGYHLTPIPKGTFGEVSKLEEELAEFKDAMAQNNRVMALVELSDLLSAMDGFLEKQFNGEIKVADLLIMAAATKRAFESGERK